MQENQELEKQKVKIKENAIKEYEQKIEAIRQSKIQENQETNNKTSKRQKEKLERKKKTSIILSIIFAIILLISVLVIKNTYVTLVSSAILIIELIYSRYTQHKEKMCNKVTKETTKVENTQENEIDILINTKEKLKQEINQTNQELEEKLKIQKEKIRNKYLGKVAIKTIEEKLNKPSVIYDISILQNKMSENKIKLQSIKLNQNDILPKLENLANLEEEYSELEEQYNELCKKSEQIELVKQEIEKAYEIMKKTITPKFTSNLSKIIEKISEGKYKNIKLEETKGMIVEIENGNYISVKHLSIGTIDEIYLSLRLGAGLEISKEKLPIILDEAFAYWDDTRLQNILNYIKEEFKDRQIIIFTCTNREKEILDKIEMKYNYIKL